MRRAQMVIILPFVLTMLVSCQERKSVSQIASELSEDYGKRLDEAECKSGAHRLRRLPEEIVMSYVRRRSNFDLNTRITSLYARCINNKVEEKYFCGMSARMNSVGYMDRESAFFGKIIINSKRNYEITEYVTDENAPSLCLERVLNR